MLEVRYGTDLVQVFGFGALSFLYVFHFLVCVRR
jgi:hypothetical protein